MSRALHKINLAARSAVTMTVYVHILPGSQLAANPFAAHRGGGAATATPAPFALTQGGRKTSMSGRTRSSPVLRPLQSRWGRSWAEAAESATRAGQGLAGLRPVRTKVVARLRSWPLNAAAV
jgi:hypothetical protein